MRFVFRQVADLVCMPQLQKLLDKVASFICGLYLLAGKKTTPLECHTVVLGRQMYVSPGFQGDVTLDIVRTSL